MCTEINLIPSDVEGKKGGSIERIPAGRCVQRISSSPARKREPIIYDPRIKEVPTISRRNEKGEFSWLRLAVTEGIVLGSKFLIQNELKNEKMKALSSLSKTKKRIKTGLRRGERLLRPLDPRKECLGGLWLKRGSARHNPL